jgi:hypothetical protein
MRRLLLALLLLAPALTLAADTHVFPCPRLGKGYAGPILFDFVWASSGAARDMTGATGALTLYSVAPVGGVGGTVLWSQPLAPVGTPADRMSLTVTPAETATPSSYAAELTVTQGGVTDALHATCRVEGY